MVLQLGGTFINMTSGLLKYCVFLPQIRSSALQRARKATQRVGRTWHDHFPKLYNNLSMNQKKQGIASHAEKQKLGIHYQTMTGKR